MPRISVLSFNIHKGFGGGGRRFTLPEIRDQIRSLGSDLVFLQEVVGANHHHRNRVATWPDSSQFEFLADMIWPHFAYGKNAVYSEGHHGNAILSKFPFTFWENIDISTNRYEKRGILHAIIKIPDLHPPLHLLCLHFNLFAAGRRRQVELLTERINEHVPASEPLIIAGDFNDWSEQISNHLHHEVHASEVFETLSGRHARSFPSWLPVLALDRIYCRGLKPLAGEILKHSPWKKLSDHIPILAHFEVQDGW